MEPSVSALTYKGSIPEAIVEAQKQKKLFVVYISGVDAESIELEKVTWIDSKVAESLSKYCIFLHIPEGSADAANFSAIYPQKSVPSIAAVGYNGVQLWQSEGFVSADILASSLEKAWLSLHIQDTTATVLSAALALKKSESSVSGSSDVVASGQGSSSGTVVPSLSTDKHMLSSEAAEEIKEKNMHGQSVELHLQENNAILDEQMPSKSSHSDNSQSAQQSISSTEEAKILPTLMADTDNSIAVQMSLTAEDSSHVQEKIINCHSGIPVITNEPHGAIRNEQAECRGDVKENVLDNSMRPNASSDVYLNIRLPNGVGLQEKFSVMSTLRMVKDYVDRNQATDIGSYDLAIPYPRKVFSDQDLNKSLSELGLFNRQALIAVPRQKATNDRGGSSSSQTTANSTALSNANDGGYFAYVKRVLSYINPLSYLGGTANSSSSGESHTGMWEYGPNTALQNNIARMERQHSSFSQNQSTSGTGNDGKKRQQASQFGSNIHTLKRDDDDDRFSDRNAFWNGNSTQYGGSNDGM